MKYLTAYYWQQKANANACSLLLQQVNYKKKHTAVFACICEGSCTEQGKEKAVAGGYLTERLRAWFYEKALFQCEKIKRGRLQVLGSSLQQTIRQAQKELGRENSTICGIFCLHNMFFTFSKEGEMTLLNTRFGRANSRSLHGKYGELSLQYGILQKGVGILLASKGLMKIADEQLVRQCLMVEEIWEKNQAWRHLQELCREAERKGAEDIAAILVLTK